MKVGMYYRDRAGSVGFLLPEDKALLGRLLSHSELPAKEQLHGKRCWLYLRVDTDRQHDQIGLLIQREKVYRFAEENEMRIVGETHELVSGGDIGRYGLQAMTKDAETGKMDYILACDRNRIFRGQSLRHLLAYEDRLHTCGVDILYPYEII